jgi:hypothetical protein
MPIDLNTLLDPHGELLHDLNEQPAYEQQDEIMSVQQDQLYDDEAHLQDQHGELLPVLNEKLRMSKKIKSLISRKISFMKIKPISKVSPYIFITMNALACMSSISMLLLVTES